MTQCQSALASLYRLLIVHENPCAGDDLLRNLSAAFHTSGQRCQISKVESLAAAQTHLRDERPQLVIMPLRRSGQALQLLFKASSRRTIIPVILLDEGGAYSHQVCTAQQLGASIVAATTPASDIHQIAVHLVQRTQSPTAAPPPPVAADALAIKDLFDALRNIAGVRFGLLASLSGIELASWRKEPGMDTATLARLATGELLATEQLGALFGSRPHQTLIIQEYNDMLVTVLRVSRERLLVVALESDAALGQVRLALRRCAAAFHSQVDA